MSENKSHCTSTDQAPVGKHLLCAHLLHFPPPGVLVTSPQQYTASLVYTYKTNHPRINSFMFTATHKTCALLEDSFSPFFWLHDFVKIDYFTGTEHSQSVYA